MKCHVELAIWIDTQDPVTEGDIERLVATIKTYVHQAGGAPEIKAYVAKGETLCILASAIAEYSTSIRDSRKDAPYIEQAVRKALSDAGMTDEQQDP